MLILKFLKIAGLDSGNKVIDKLFATDELDRRKFILLSHLMANCMKQMSLTKTDRTVKKQGVVSLAG